MAESLDNAVLSMDGNGYTVAKEGPEQVGIIYGNVGTSSFECQISSPLEKAEYIECRHDTCGTVLGQVDSIERRTNLSIDKAQLLSEGEDVEIKEKVSAKIVVVGYRDERGILQTPRTPFKAGVPIHKATEATIRRVIGLEDNPTTGSYLGLLHGHKIKVYLDINSMVQKHVSVLAKTGGGKSYACGVIIEELLKHGVTTVILDPHGEYPSMKKKGKPSKVMTKFDIEPKNYSDRILEFSPDTKINKGAKPLKFTLSNLDARSVLSLTSIKNSRTFITPLRRVLDALKATQGDYSIKDIIRMLEREEDAALGSLLSELDYLDEVNIFAKEGTQITELVVEGKTTIINLKGVPPDIQTLIVNRISTALFELRKINKIPPLMLVTEEAHNFCPQQGTVASSKIFRTIASEGRKFGLGLAVVTQRPAKVDKNVLSQCNTQILLKVTNPNDIKAITASVEGLTSGMTEDLQRLPIGIAIITGGGITMPLFVSIRPRETTHGGESVSIIKTSG